MWCVSNWNTCLSLEFFIIVPMMTYYGSDVEFFNSLVKFRSIEKFDTFFLFELLKYRFPWIFEKSKEYHFFSIKFLQTERNTKIYRHSRNINSQQNTKQYHISWTFNTYESSHRDKDKIKQETERPGKKRTHPDDKSKRLFSSNRNVRHSETRQRQTRFKRARFHGRDKFCRVIVIFRMHNAHTHNRIRLQWHVSSHM